MGERFAGREDEDAATIAALEEIYRKLINKAEFLVAMQNPPVKFKSEELTIKKSFSKVPSYMNASSPSDVSH